MAKIDLKNVRLHNRELSKGGVGKETEVDVRDTIEDDLPKFCQTLQRIRKGLAENKKGHKLPPVDMPFEKALQTQYGIANVNAFFQIFGLSSKTSSIRDLARTFGVDNLTVTGMENFMIDHSQFSNPMSTTDIDSSYRFIIPEVFANAIRLGYQHGVMHQNWIGSTQVMAQEKLVMPQILRGDGMPSRVNEGANIPMGSISFGKKEVEIFKIGTGFKITDELLMASSLDMLSIFLGEVGNDMGIGADSQAFIVLINGEQADLSESAPVVGVLNTGNGFTYKDIKKVFTRMNRLRQPGNRVVTGEDDGVDITSIDRFEGFQGQTKLASIRSIMGVPEVFDMDTYTLPANKIMFLNKERAMTKLQYRGLMTERRRNPQNQTEELYISDWINFAIIKRDARVILDKSVTIGASPFPSYMDVDARINQAYAAI
jgi:HK97 family phage major capsid protein